MGQKIKLQTLVQIFA